MFYVLFLLEYEKREKCVFFLNVILNGLLFSSKNYCNIEMFLGLGEYCWRGMRESYVIFSFYFGDYVGLF